MGKIAKIIVLLMLTTLVGGCWDKIEIENRAYISAVGIDLYKGEDKGDQDSTKESSRNKFSITYVFPNIDAIGKNASSEETRFVLTSVGPNSYETSRMITSRINKVVTFKQLDAILLGEEVARNADYLKENLDAVDRNSQINRKVTVAIVEGTAKEIIEIESPFEPVTGQLIAQIEEKKGNLARFNQFDLGDILESIHGNGCALMPRIVPAKDEIKLAGSAIIKNYRLIGWLGELENRAVMILRNQVRSEIETVNAGGTDVPFIISNTDTKKEVSVDNENIKFDFIIEMEGFIEQYELDLGKDTLDTTVISSIEKAVEENIREQLMMTIAKLQKEFNTDVIGVGNYLSKFKPDVWEKVKDNWEDIFPKVDINVSVDVKLRRVGMTR